MIKHTYILAAGLLAAIPLLSATALPVSAQQTATAAPTAAATEASPIDLSKLPLGDQKISTSPQRGYIYICHSGNSGGGGAFQDGPWINSAAGIWDSTTKINVSGSVAWPEAKFTMTTSGDQRVFSGNGLPINAITGTFPIGASDSAYKYDRNPNHIAAQKISLSVPLNPTVAAKSGCVDGGMIGIETNGVPLFDGFDAGDRDAGAHEIQDQCGGHPQQDSQYHYHGISPCLTDSDGSNLVGYAADGFGIYGFHGDKQYTNADLDECHGLTSPVMWNGQLTTIYHYQATHEFPYTIGCFRGTAVKTVGTPGNGGPQGSGNGTPTGPGNGGPGPGNGGPQPGGPGPGNGGPQPGGPGPGNGGPPPTPVSQ